MLITQTLDITVNQGNLGFLKKYFPHVNSGMNITIPALMFKGSTNYVEVQCDYCNEVVDVQVKNYVISTEKYHKYSCKNPKCQSSKRKELQVLGINKTKEKFKLTSLERYGFESPRQSESVKEKIKKTIKERYGSEPYAKNGKLRKKIEKTMIDRYGVPHISHNEDFRKIKYDIAKDTNYIKFNTKNKLNVLKCDKNENHNYEIDKDVYTSRRKHRIPLCTVCNPVGESTSIKQQELTEFVASLVKDEIVINYKDGLEIDIFIPNLNIGFEFNGLYWNSNKFKENNYHANKTKYFEQKGIRIFYIWEDDWDNKREIIKSQIENLLGLSKKIYARNTKIKEVKYKEALEFLKENHIQGGYIGIQKAYGLYYKDEIVALMTFDHKEGRKNMKATEWNLSRFCNKKGTAVIGGASKLLKNFKKQEQPTKIISYADADWSKGNLYEVLGFKMIYKSRPDYKYIVEGKREHKSKYKKPKGSLKTESQLMKEAGIYKVYDCGKIKYELN